jgi:quercetin dioxygenase-like cupin family protein
MKSQIPSIEFGKLISARAQAMGTLRVKTLIGGAPESPLSVLLIGMKAFAAHPPLHHARTSEFFLVTRGSAEAKIAGRARRLRRGDYVFLPPGAVHQFRAGAKGVEVLTVFMPALDLGKPDIVMQKH